MLCLKTSTAPCADDLLDAATAAAVLATDLAELARARREHALPSYPLPTKTFYRRGDLTLYAAVIARRQAGEPVVRPPEVAATAPLTVLGLPTRVYHALRAEGVATVGELAALTPTRLRRVPGLGDKSCRQVTESLAEAGYRLSEEATATPVLRLPVAA